MAHGLHRVGGHGTSDTDERADVDGRAVLPPGGRKRGLGRAACVMYGAMVASTGGTCPLLVADDIAVAGEIEYIDENGGSRQVECARVMLTATEVFVARFVGPAWLLQPVFGSGLLAEQTTPHEGPLSHITHRFRWWRLPSSSLPSSALWSSGAVGLCTRVHLCRRKAASSKHVLEACNCCYMHMYVRYFEAHTIPGTACTTLRITGVLCSV